MARPIREILNSDINYFEKKVNKYLDNLNNTVIRHERLLEYLKNYAEKYFDEENQQQ